MEKLKKNSFSLQIFVDTSRGVACISPTSVFISQSKLRYQIWHCGHTPHSHITPVRPTRWKYHGTLLLRHLWFSLSEIKMRRENRNVVLQNWNLSPPSADLSSGQSQSSLWRISGGRGPPSRGGKLEPRSEQHLHRLGQLILHISVLSEGIYNRLGGILMSE